MPISAAKRGFDLLLSFALALPALAVLAPAAIVICLNSRGPAVFRQVRIGRDHKLFTLYKLRTMYLGTGDSPSHHAAVNQITPVGRWLRRAKIDELPQLVNVVRGDMSFVGPRPCLPSQLELINERRRRGVLRIQPGITGLAQVNGIDMSDPVRLAEKDAEYAACASLRVDLLILVRTLIGSGSGDAIK